MKSSILILAVPTLFLVTGCEEPPHQHAFIDMLGTDTISMEVFTHTYDYVEGSLLNRNPVTRMATYRADFGDAGIERFEVRWSTPEENPDGPAPEHSVFTFHGDSVTIVKEGGRNPGTTTVAVTDHSFPVVGISPYSYGMLEQVVIAAMSSGADEFDFSTIQAGSPRIPTNAVERRGPDTVSTDYFGNPFLWSVADGHITGRTGRETTVKLEGRPMEPVAISQWAAEFAARDARDEGLGVPSPGATVQLTAFGANLEVVYSQPAVRGREIWGGLIPFGEVWRTGANAATQFTTDRDLTIGGERVPAGSYTLWSIFTPDSATLIINSQTGQWGTQYDESQDFVRVPMMAQALDEPVERFTIELEESTGGALIGLSWDRTRFIVHALVR